MTAKPFASFVVVGLLVTATVGCGRRATVATGDPVLTSATAWLVRQQSPDGAWRSDTYGTFKDGPALTPVVLVALDGLPESLRPAEACTRGQTYLSSFVHEGQVREPEVGFDYPVYTAAMSVMVLPPGPARDAWLAYLRERQLTETLGWAAADPEYGGWGYCRTLPRKPKLGEFAAALTESNLSATRFAVEALRAAGVSADDPALTKARVFVERCQNYAAEDADLEYDDGGFFFIYNDPVRNKAGILGTDKHQRERYASYGSTSADGVRALLACGAGLDDERVIAGQQWLTGHFDPARVPGHYREQHEALRSAVYFYYASALAGALRFSDGPDGWRAALRSELARRQNEDGSWTNPADAMRENDPVAATALAVAALAALIEDEPGR